MYKVLIIGDIYYETQFLLDTIPSVNEVTITEQATSVVGSKTINVARAFNTMNVDFEFFGLIGDDQLASIVEPMLSQYVKNVANIHRVKNEKTGQIFVQTNKEGRSSITLYFGANAEVSPDNIVKLEDQIKQSSLIYTGTHLPLASLYTLISICKKNDVPIFLDVPNQQKELDKSYLKGVTFLCPNRQEAGQLTNMNIESIENAEMAILSLRKYCPQTIIITLDEDGCMLLDQNSTTPVLFNTRKTKCIDSTGSGDIFRAVFVSNWLATKSVSTSIEKALAAGTNSIEYSGIDNTLQNLTL